MAQAVVIAALLAAFAVVTVSWLTDVTFARGGGHYVAMFLLSWAVFLWVLVAAW